jgi:hypothetical protein
MFAYGQNMHGAVCASSKKKRKRVTVLIQLRTIPSGKKQAIVKTSDRKEKEEDE